MMVSVLINKMDTHVAVRQVTADVIVKFVRMSAYPRRPVKMVLNVLHENSKITSVLVALVGLENNVMNEKVSILQLMK